MFPLVGLLEKMLDGTTVYFFLYFMDRVLFCNISVIQQDTQYLMINFVHSFQ